MKCCEIHAGMLTERVYFQRRTRTPDGMGGYVETWSNVPDERVAVSLQPLSGTEAFRAMRVTPRATYRLYMRYRDNGSGHPFYTPADKVVYKGREFDILQVFNVEMADRWINMLLNEGALS